jgi:hypothetical protein
MHVVIESALDIAKDSLDKVEMRGTWTVHEQAGLLNISEIGSHECKIL